MSTLRAYRDALVENLVTDGIILSSAIQEAFRIVPRHLFISSYYERQGHSWQQKAATDTQAWYQKIYSDTSLVTSIDHAGRTLSSSSQPGIMAQMLEALDIQAGHRVLEIGTGTGYNAALLAQLVGKAGHVVTLDIEKEITDTAQAHLIAAGFEQVEVHCEDGRQGYSSSAPYDRIIATCSTPVIPVAWQDQLVSGGCFVGIVQPGISMAGGIVQARKNNNVLAGRLLSAASFMPIHGSDFRTLPARIPHLNMQQPVIATFGYSNQLFDREVIWTPDFQFFLYATIPTLYIVEQTRSDGRDYTLFYDEDQPENYVALSQGVARNEVELLGRDAPILWKRLIQIYILWIALGQPTISDLWFKMEQDGQQYIYLTGEQGMIWPFV